MNTALPQKINGKPRILVAPLDWGLGHATRCIPLIQQLIALDTDVWLAGEGAQATLLKDEFPTLPFLPLKGYRITYSKSANGFLWKMLRQIGHLRKAIHSENAWLKEMVKKYSIDAVISDNRYGLYHPGVYSVLITHQLNIKTSMGKWSERQLQKWNYKYVNHFNECWVPDLPGQQNLAGELSHPSQLPSIPLKYLGVLSRFKTSPKTEVKKGKLLIILSGPEPQRTMLEDKIISQVAHYNGYATVLRGLPGEASLIPSSNMIQFYNHMDSAGLQNMFNETEYVIARSGYSTIMDAISLGKKCIFIPTPGQTEQQYLAKELFLKKMALQVDQKEFILSDAIKSAENFPFEHPSVRNEELEPVLKEFLSRINHQTALG